MRTKHHPFFGALRPLTKIEALTQKVPAPRQSRHKGLATLALLFGGLAAPLHGEFIYVTSFDHAIWGYSIGTGGTLTAVPGSPFFVHRRPLQVAVDPAGPFLYVAKEENGGGPSGRVASKRIGSDGALTDLAPSQNATFPGSVVVDPTDQFVYVADEIGLIFSYSIGPHGKLTPIPGSPFGAGGAPASLAVDPRGRFLYGVNFTHNTILGYSIGSGGNLTALTGSPFPAGSEPETVAVDPTGQFVYVANGGDNTVSGYSIAADGNLTAITGSPFPAGTFPVSVAVDPAGKFVYVTNTDDNTISGYRIGLGGALTAVPGSPFATGNQPGSVAVDPAGKFVYVVNTRDNTVSGYSIAPHGKLTAVSGSPFATGTVPQGIAITR